MQCIHCLLQLCCDIFINLMKWNDPDLDTRFPYKRGIITLNKSVINYLQKCTYHLLYWIKWAKSHYLGEGGGVSTGIYFWRGPPLFTDLLVNFYCMLGTGGSPPRILLLLATPFINKLKRLWGFQKVEEVISVSQNWLRCFLWLLVS